MRDAELSQAGMCVRDDLRHFFPHLSYYFQNIFPKAHENILLFLLMIYISEAAREQVLTFFLTFD